MMSACTVSSPSSPGGRIRPSPPTARIEAVGKARPAEAYTSSAAA